ncbi:MAG: cytochrome C [Planctomycetota bacterium]|jgi:hypothetical protein
MNLLSSAADGLLAGGLSFSFFWENVLGKPDNLPIVIMLVLVGFFTYWAFSMGRKNDLLKEHSGDPKRDIFYPPEESKFPKRIHVWPWLLRNEMLCAILVTALMIIWSIALDAPLEDPADPSITPNPSKAPWYFLGLQEMLVYFDPWIAGVVMPTLIIVGLMALPYIDVNPKGNGYYTLKERPFAIATFAFGFHVLWIILIVVGTIMRGPGWIFFWPGQYWDPHAVVSSSNNDLSELMGVATKTPYGEITMGHMAIGSIAVIGFMVACMVIPYLYLKAKKSPTLERMGHARFWLTAFLGASMLGLVAKIALRMILNVKYILVTPWFNI